MKIEAGTGSLTLGEKAPYFSLPGTDGKIHSLADYVGRKRALVIIFTCNHCPYARAYESRICALARHYMPLGVGFVAICSNDGEDYPEDSFPQMVEKSRDLELPFPYLHDATQAVARAYDAHCTPECFVFDAELRLAYHGRVDDNYESEELVESHDLQSAIEAVLKETLPSNPFTPVIGCSIKWTT